MSRQDCQASGVAEELAKKLFDKPVTIDRAGGPVDIRGAAEARDALSSPDWPNPRPSTRRGHRRLSQGSRRS